MDMDQICPFPIFRGLNRDSMRVNSRSSIGTQATKFHRLDADLQMGIRVARKLITKLMEGNGEEVIGSVQGAVSGILQAESNASVAK
mmetsp:Transcript_26360/g.63571  ORF Transcript_26360/g.63571 Transcript_26360/m.63571 type:complete len:87 (+) Transcript_26360:1555-1815(+)